MIHAIKGWIGRLSGRKHKTNAADEIMRILDMTKEEREKYMRENYPHFTRKTHDPEKRLEYYRSHGLTDCFDYPGGDEAFERDVLSGEQRDEGIYYGPFKNEDAYIIQCMRDGRFQFDPDFTTLFYVRPHVELEYYENPRGWICLDYPMSDYARYKADILSGRYGVS